MAYFYTDPLAAAWMSKHFGMKIEDESIESFQIGAWASLKMLAEAKPVNIIGWDKLYIHPDSLGLLKPRIGDLVIHRAGFKPEKLTEWKAMPGQPMFWAKGTPFLPVPVDNVHAIIQRDDIPFHWPECEAA